MIYLFLLFNTLKIERNYTVPKMPRETPKTPKNSTYCKHQRIKKTDPLAKTKSQNKVTQWLSIFAIVQKLWRTTGIKPTISCFLAADDCTIQEAQWHCNFVYSANAFRKNYGLNCFALFFLNLESSLLRILRADLDVARSNIIRN